MSPHPVKRAILSVTDKTGLAEFAAFLAQGGVELVSTGGTRKMLLEEGLQVTAVSEVTGFPEILGGRVKTLHPRIAGGVLADTRNPEHLAALAEHDIPAVDLVCVNLYDFARARAMGLDLEQAVEQIDIGGPTMLRSAAKNFHAVLVVPDPTDYGRVMDSLRANDFAAPLELRRQLAAKTFALTSRYDAMIADYLGRFV